MRPLLKYLLPLLFALNASAQVNLVPNGDFEQHDTCPYSIFPNIEDVLGNGWYTPSPNPDYFNVCGLTQDLLVPGNIIGYQNANSGNGYIGFDASYHYTGIPGPNDYYNNLRELLGVKLNYKLTKDSIYTIGFYVSLADSFSYSMRNWGCMFSVDSIYLSPQQTALELTQKFIEDTTSIKVDFFPDSALKNVEGWTKIEATFKAKGGEQQMYIGSFMQWYDIVWEDSPNIGIVHPHCGYCPGAYYYIDDIYLYGDTNYKVVGIEEIELEKTTLFPNPASNTLTISTGNLQNAQVDLFDIAGRRLFQQKLTASQQSIDVSGYSNGIYICTITSNGKVVKREKVVISR